MKKKQLYSFKKECRDLMNLCHDIQNRVVEKMCSCDEKQVLVLKDYLNCLKTVECLCKYCCCCCCCMEELSENIKKEVLSKCKSLTRICKKLKEMLDKETSDYLACDKVIKHCNKCSTMCSEKKRKTRKN
jgi:hypothetical protein